MARQPAANSVIVVVSIAAVRKVSRNPLHWLEGASVQLLANVAHDILEGMGIHVLRVNAHEEISDALCGKGKRSSIPERVIGCHMPH
ncbi:hypothetical protein GCM10010340_64910 [Streptomyces griseoloalbus]|nr:hypothetical protein GCM10010340_64910 [Streptomyces albaduncus]